MYMSCNKFRIAFAIILTIALHCPNMAVAQLFDLQFTVLDKVKYCIEYSQQSVPDSNNPGNVKNGRMLLFVGDSISLYESRSLYISDTIMRKFQTHEDLQTFASNPNKPSPATRYRIYKNYPPGKLTCIEPLLFDQYKYIEPLNAFDWVMEPDTATINNYRVQKATCVFGGRNWTAWFCPEIPISDGPYKFNGLPGLIVKMYDSRNHYVLQMESISIPAGEILIDIEQKIYTESTKEQFFKAKNSMADNAINIVKDKGADDESARTAAQNIAKRNNHIELFRK